MKTEAEKINNQQGNGVLPCASKRFSAFSGDELMDLILSNYGKKILRKNTHDRWVTTFINDTYVKLILEFPEDYALID